MMLVGALGMKIVSAAYFGVVERFSVFAATGFNAALGLCVFFGGFAFCKNAGQKAGTKTEQARVKEGTSESSEAERENIKNS